MDTNAFLEKLVEPELEVVKRMAMHMGPISISDAEPKLLKAAHNLTVQGWLKADGAYPCAGRQYWRFKAGRLDMAKIKGRW